MDTRTQILDAARRLIDSKGLAAATTKEIASAAGCAEGTLYKHFRDKEDLFITVFKERMPEFVQLVRELSGHAGKGTVRRNLEEVAVSALAFFETIVPAISSLFARPELLDGYRKAMQEQGAGPFMAFRHLSDYLDAERRLGRLDGRTDPSAVASLLLGTCHNYVFVSHTFGAHPNGMDPARFARAIVKTLYDGIAPREKERK